MNEVFLDTSFAIALSSVITQNDLQTVKFANQIETNRNHLVNIYKELFMYSTK